MCDVAKWLVINYDGKNLNLNAAEKNTKRALSRMLSQMNHQMTTVINFLEGAIVQWNWEWYVKYIVACLPSLTNVMSKLKGESTCVRIEAFRTELVRSTHGMLAVRRLSCES